MELPKDQLAALADSLGDMPETLISVHLLRRDLARAFVLGSLRHFDAAIVQQTDYPNEPTGFGEDASAMWRLLQGVTGWDCVNVSESLAPKLGALIVASTGVPVRRYGDVYHRLGAGPPPSPRGRGTGELGPSRRLTPDDLWLLDSAAEELRIRGWGSNSQLLESGVAAGAVIDGRLVSIAATSARTGRHADVAVATLPEWRGRGLATSAASLVVGEVLAAGQTPVWSTGEDNYASLRIARRLGFVECGRRAYLIPSRDRRSVE